MISIEEEIRMREYLDNNVPDGIVSAYWWTPGWWYPRIDWMSKQIEIEKAKEVEDDNNTNF
jgi:hypothetical protein